MENKNATANPQQQNGEWVSMMDEESKKGGAFFKMLPTDEKIVTILSDPVKAQSNFQEKDKPPKTEFRVKLIVDGQPGELIWGIGNRSVMSQLVGIARNYRLSTLVGAKLMIKTSGTDLKNRAWFIMLMSAPGMQAPVFPQAASAPAPAPAAAPYPQQLDPGAQWLEQQRNGMVQQGVQPAGAR
jgi:hypothetical protein